MAFVDIDQFRQDHRAPVCDVGEITIAVNSKETDPATTDPIPRYLDVPICRTHGVQVDPLSIASTAPFETTDS